MTSEWQDELVSFATNQIFLGGESVVEAFLSGKILTVDEKEDWNTGHMTETVLIPTLVTRIIDFYAKRKVKVAKIEWLYEMPKPYIDEWGNNEIDVNKGSDSEKVKEAIQTHLLNRDEDSLIIIGLSQDMDGLTPMGIWSIFNQTNFEAWENEMSGLDFWGVVPADLNTIGAIMIGELESLPINIEEPDGKKIGNTIFNNYESGRVRWDCYEEQKETFRSYLYDSGIGILGFAMKVTLVSAPERTVINWTEFPVLLI